MLNTTIIFIYAPFAILTAVILCIELVRRLKRNEDFHFILTCVCIACWFGIQIATILTNDVVVLNAMIQFGLIFVGFLPPCLLLFALGFYKIFKLPLFCIVLMFIVPVCTAVVAITGSSHQFMIQALDVESLAPIREFTIIWGPWFWVHTICCYITSIVMVIVILVFHFRKQRFYRLPSTLMVTGILFTLSGNLFALLKVFPDCFDPTLITVSLALVLFHLAIINNQNSTFMRFSRNQIIHHLNELILIINDKDSIVDYNRPAEKWFSEQKIPLAVSSLQAVKDALLRRGQLIGDDSYRLYTPHLQILQLSEQTLQDEVGERLGTIAVFSDVTQNHMLLERLEAKAKIDSMTGIPNRAAYDGALERLDAPESFPLTVIVCDLNGLKYVNDTFGHQYGDLMLQKTADILDKHCAEEHFVGRVGGDEFIFLLPNTSDDVVRRMISKIKSDLSACRDLPFPISISMGSATKTSADEPIEDVIAKADSRMYEDKRQRIAVVKTKTTI